MPSTSIAETAAWNGGMIRNKKGRFSFEKRPFCKLAPRAGLEPATKWLQMFPIFLSGLDYLITLVLNVRVSSADGIYWSGILTP